VEHVEAAELVDGGADRRLQAVWVGHVGTDRDRFVSSEVSGFLAGPGVDLSNGHFRAFAGEQDCGGAADPVTGAGDEGYLACEPDKSDAARRKPQTAALVTITSETDSLYLDTPGQCAFENRGWRRRIAIKKDAAASSVVWKPWAEKAATMVDLGDPAWRGMVCVETGNIADNEVRLAADDEHQMSATISVDAGS